MDNIYYALHKLIEVVVDARVSDKTKEAVNYQIGYFKTKTNHNHAPYKINIRPYSDFSIDPTCTIYSFHVSRGIVSQCLDNPDDQLAFVKEKSGYTIYVDKSYFPINFFIQLLFVEHGISLISAAAVIDSKGRVMLLFGTGGAGKTVLSVEMVKNRHYHLLGDDTVCLGEHGDCLSFPRNFMLKKYHRHTYAEIIRQQKDEAKTKNSFSLKSTAIKLLRFARENAPLLGILNRILDSMGRPDLQLKLIPSFSPPKKESGFNPVSIDKIVGASKIAEKGIIDRVLYLERYAGTDFKNESISADSLCRRAISTIHNEWALNMRIFFKMGAMEIIDIPGYFNRVASIIRSGISKKQCDLILIPENASPNELKEYFFSFRK